MSVQTFGFPQAADEARPVSVGAPRAWWVLAASALALLLAGCAGGVGGGDGNVGPMGSGNAGDQGLFGSSMQTTTVRPTGNGGGSTTVAAGTPGAAPVDSDFTCPSVEVRGGEIGRASCRERVSCCV